ncbi:hypothetical protein D3C77_28910 [compost metagenome]
MSQKNREPGFYWVKFYVAANWEVVEFVDGCGGVWRIGDLHNGDFIYDEDLYEIDERRIVREEPSK